MANIHNLIGRKFGTLTVIRRTKNEKGNQARFICKCDCGKELVVYAAVIKPQIETATKPKWIKN